MTVIILLSNFKCIKYAPTINVLVRAINNATPTANALKSTVAAATERAVNSNKAIHIKIYDLKFNALLCFVSIEINELNKTKGKEISRLYQPNASKVRHFHVVYNYRELLIHFLL